jgi:crotonobetainyl-CoA:carnitine CoA-transferase CaiB-like acyl-CoA transferase
MVVSLYHKEKSGEITRARTSLSAVTNVAQLPFAFDYQGRAPFDEPSGRKAMGNHALSHFYQASDGWIFLDSDRNELQKLETLEPLKGISDAENIAAFLTAAFKRHPADYWADLLHQADIAAAVPQSIEFLRDRYSRIADDRVGIDKGSFAFSIYPDHPSGHRVTRIDQYAIRPLEATIKALAPTERFGHSTRNILGNLGYSEAEIESMVERGIAGLGWGKEYLPS